MQKKLIALAVASLAAGSAFAQSNVTISGYISSGYAVTKYSGGQAGALNGLATASSNASGTSTPLNANNKVAAHGVTNGTEQGVIDSRLSRIRFAGTEDLGNGLKAEFQVESRFMSDTSDATAGLGAMGVGDTFVGLNGNWGRVRLGRMDTYYADGVGTELIAGTTFQSHATLSLLSQVEGLGYHGTAGRWNNQIRYDSPRISGFQGTLAYSTNRAAEDGAAENNGDRNGAWYAAANYFAGPIFAGVSAFSHKNEGNSTTGLTGTGLLAALVPTTSNADLKSSGYRVYGSYTFPMGIKVGLNWDYGKRETSTTAFLKRNAWFIPVQYAFGANTIGFTYGKAEKTKNQAGPISDSGARFMNLSYNYALSRRTNVGVNYTVLNNKSASNYDLLLGGFVKGLGQTQFTTAGQDVRQFAVSLVHAF